MSYVKAKMHQIRCYNSDNSTWIAYFYVATFKFSPRAMAKSTLSVSFEQASKHSTMTRLKLGISAVGQRYSSKKNKKNIIPYRKERIG